MAVSAKGIPYIAFSTVCPKQRSVQISSPFLVPVIGLVVRQAELRLVSLSAAARWGLC